MPRFVLRFSLAAADSSVALRAARSVAAWSGFARSECSVTCPFVLAGTAVVGAAVVGAAVVGAAVVGAAVVGGAVACGAVAAGSGVVVGVVVGVASVGCRGGAGRGGAGVGCRAAAVMALLVMLDTSWRDPRSTPTPCVYTASPACHAPAAVMLTPSS